MKQALSASQRDHPAADRPWAKVGNGTISPMYAARSLKRSSKSVWQILICLTLFALLFRAAFPAGYMPGPSSQGGGALTVTLCAGHGDTTLVPVNFHGDAPDHDGTTQGCPFCAVLAQAVMPGAATLAVAAAITHQSTLLLPDGVPALTTQTAGPPLGSRAPPAFLG